jgi:hypothetical protein
VAEAVVPMNSHGRMSTLSIRFSKKIKCLWELTKRNTHDLLNAIGVNIVDTNGIEQSFSLSIDLVR